MIQQKQKMYLTAEAIYRYLAGDNEEIDTLIMCNNPEITLVTTDQSLYEALGSIEDRSKINMNKLVKLLEVVDTSSFKEMMKKQRTILTEERVEEIRNRTSDKEKQEKDNTNTEVSK